MVRDRVYLRSCSGNDSAATLFSWPPIHPMLFELGTWLYSLVPLLKYFLDRNREVTVAAFFVGLGSLFTYIPTR